jgi:dTDP-4-amino-4,6-dideoxygalactose transaminase
MRSPTLIRQKVSLRGRDAATGKPTTVEITAADVNNAIQPPLEALVENIRDAFENIPAELAEDILPQGLYLSGGGALLTDSRQVAERARKRAQQSREKALWYEHREAGYNYRLSNVLAAIGLAQLDRLGEMLSRRAAVARWYAENWKGDLLAPGEGSNNWLNVAVLPSRARRDALLRRFAAADIEARPVWKPMHLQPVFKGCRTYGGEVAAELFARGVCLPSGCGLT